MVKKLTGEALAKFEATRDVWQEVLDGVRESKAGGGKLRRIEASVCRMCGIRRRKAIAEDCRMPSGGPR